MPIQPLLGIAEPVSAVSHLVGALVALGAAPRLIRQGRGRTPAMIGLSVFAVSSILLLATSGIYHAMAHETEARFVLRRLDHAAIFVLIAGSFTPVHAIVFRGPLRWAALLAIWSIALAGLTLKTIFFTALPESVGIAFYLGMGWLGAGTGIVLWRYYGFGFVLPAVLGGLAYTVGGLVGFAGRPVVIPGIVGAHELFHFAALAGVYAFWRFTQHVIGCRPIGRPGRITGPDRSIGGQGIAERRPQIRRR